MPSPTAKVKPENTVRFAWWGDEHGGRFGVELLLELGWGEGGELVEGALFVVAEADGDQFVDLLGGGVGDADRGAGGDGRGDVVEGVVAQPDDDGRVAGVRRGCRCDAA